MQGVYENNAPPKIIVYMWQGSLQDDNVITPNMIKK
jgi:hypothetical protein